MIYNAGGGPTGADFLSYDPVADAWSSQPTVPTGGAQIEAGAAANGAMYVIVVTAPIGSGTSTEAFTPLLAGPPGPTGPQGPAGATGAAGAQGPAGPVGATGPQGAAGPIGATGSQGPTGPAGATGATGAQGPAGIPGPIGPQGATGPAGPQGPAGTSLNWRGAWANLTNYLVNDAVSYNGSSYVAVAANNNAQPNSNPTSWNLMASVGATGAAGPQGAQGPAGATGPQGPAGVPGPIGPQGPAGPSGSQTWNTFVLNLGTSFRVSAFTPDRAITVTRMQAQLMTAPAGCSVNPVITISDGTAGGTRSLTISAAANDSGTLTLNYSAAALLTLSATHGTGCKTTAAHINVVVQYLSH